MLIKLPANELLFMVPALAPTASPVVSVAHNASGLLQGSGLIRVINYASLDTSEKAERMAAVQVCDATGVEHCSSARNKKMISRIRSKFYL